MVSSPSPTGEHEKFSLPLFLFTVFATLAGLLVALRFLAPTVWQAQFLAPVSYGIAAFFGFSLLNCFVEYIFHRYVLHLPAIPLLSRFYKQHTLHHALTRIGRRSSKNGRGILFIENKYPIIEPEQGEASFFPWYTLAIFAVILMPLFTLLQWVFPSVPWFFAGFAALTSSLMLYEILHAIEHWSFEKWEPLIIHPVWGRFWRPLYGFHLRHHAVIDCNESISGFFGLPVADWALGTCTIPKTVYADGEEWAAEKFTSPRPTWLIRQLDTWAVQVVEGRRTAARAESEAGEPRFTRAEEVANWVTHGIGLLASIVGLTLLIAFANARGGAWHVVSFTVFGLALLVLYTASTLYHAWRTERGKQLFRKLEHAAAFLVIAGTYTPFLLTNLGGPWGWTLFGVIWGLCGAGVVFQLFFGDRLRQTTTLTFLFVGWLIVLAIKPALAGIPNGGLWLILAGALCYAIGALFYLWKRLRFHHAFWHTFVLGGSTCHFLAVFLFLLPPQA